MLSFKKKNDDKQALASSDKSLAPSPLNGSIQAVAQSKGGVAMALLDAEILLICDRSGSMDTSDAMHGKKRYEIEDRVVADLQAEFPGKIIVMAFADTSIICLNGELPYPNGVATVMSTAFELAAKILKRNMRAILLTDGEATDSQDVVLRAAAPLAGKLDIVYVGSDYGAGRKFLELLTQQVAGTFQANKLDNPKILEGTIKKLFLPAGRK